VLALRHARAEASKELQRDGAEAPDAPAKEDGAEDGGAAGSDEGDPAPLEW
jgi:hypothetical protein